jgi:glucose-1-phosphate cytidylyltransferase
MKVVLFCGGLGTRLREYSETIPKPLVDIGNRPILWNVMKYYAHFGHKEFILCLGYGSNMIKNYFLKYNECDSNNFTFEDGGKKIQIFNNDISDWKITFVDTGIHSNLGERLMQVKEHIGDDEYFLANYSDGLSDLDLPSYLDDFYRKDAIASFLLVKPSQSFHSAHLDDKGLITEIRHVKDTDFRINGGFLAFRRDIFDYMQKGEELVEKPFNRLIEINKLAAHKYDGFWAAIDTFKDKHRIDEMHAYNKRPWEVWNAEIASEKNGSNGDATVLAKNLTLS